MKTFQKFLEFKENKDNYKSLNLIRSGNNLRKNECGNFWDDFANLCGNSDAMSELLEIPKDKISGWTGKINKLRETVNTEDSNKTNKKNKIIKNGEL